MTRRSTARTTEKSNLTKVCACCGRTVEWRKKWERDWDQVRYCSDRCRSRKVRPIDEQLEASILELLERRANGASVCPSEVARQVHGQLTESGDDGWRNLMEPTRAAARRLVAAGSVEITQKGNVVDPSTAKGPIRIRRRANG